MGCASHKGKTPKPIAKKPIEKPVKEGEIPRKPDTTASSFWDNQSQNNNKDRFGEKEEQTISSIENIYYYYRFLKKLGNGAFGSVMLGQQTKEPFRKVAIKIIDKKSVKGTPSFYLKREVDIIKSVDHPNICRFLETYMDKDHIYLVMEYCSGGTLRDKFINKENLTEYQVSQVMQKLFYAINYMHTRNIVHRDLKLENVVYVDNSEDAEIKVIDFGLSKKLNIRQSRKRHTKVGSSQYMAPEVLLHEKYDRECDVWSLGVMMYFLLSRELPFEDINQIEAGKFKFDSPVWTFVSSEAKNLIKSILLVSTKRRIRLNQALEHRWFGVMKEQFEGKSEIISLPVPHRSYAELVEKLIQFKMDTSFKREVLMIMVRHMNPNENTTPRLLFQNIDRDQNGVLTPDELRLCLYELGYTDSQNIDHLVLKISGINKKENLSLKQGQQNTDYINYSEFMAATLDEKVHLNKTKLKQIFSYLNPSETGFITVSDIQDIMAREGRKLPEEKMGELLNEIEDYFSEPGKLSFDDFCKAIGVNFPNSQVDLINEIEIQFEDQDPDKQLDKINTYEEKTSIPILPLNI